jgi:hypothetical protein
MYPSTATEFTREGTLAHEVAEAIVRGKPLDSYGEVTQEMIQCAEAYRDYISELIIDDNAVEYRLNEAEEYVYTSEQVLNGIRVTSFPFFQKAETDGDVYLGIIENTIHPRRSSAFITYVMTGK